MPSRTFVDEPIAFVDKPESTVEPQLVVADPFGDEFDQEEVVIDQQVVQSTEIFSNRTRVASREGRELVVRLLSRHIGDGGMAIVAAHQDINLDVPTQKIQLQ